MESCCLLPVHHTHKSGIPNNGGEFTSEPYAELQGGFAAAEGTGGAVDRVWPDEVGSTFLVSGIPK